MSMSDLAKQLRAIVPSLHRETSSKATIIRAADELERWDRGLHGLGIPVKDGPFDGSVIVTSKGSDGSYAILPLHDALVELGYQYKAGKRCWQFTKGSI